METDSKLSQLMGKALERLNEQVWFQQIKAKWDELDNQSQFYLKLVSSGAVALMLLGVVFSAWSGVRDSRRQVNEKTDLVRLIENAIEERRRLQSEVSGGATLSGAAQSAWPEYFQNAANIAGISSESVSVGQPKTGTEGEVSSESLFEINLKKINIRQLARYGYQLEHGGRPVKLRNLKVDADDELTGYMDATLSVSAFTPKEAGT